MRICQHSCVYQSNGLCTLDAMDLLGQPMSGGACLHPPVKDAVQLGSPHRYCGPESTLTPWGPSTRPHDKPV